MLQPIDIRESAEQMRSEHVRNRLYRCATDATVHSVGSINLLVLQCIYLRFIVIGGRRKALRVRMTHAVYSSGGLCGE
jgi:hypothetical protein